VTRIDPESSTFQKRPAYRYIRATDNLPTIDEARDEAIPMARVKLFAPSGGWTWFINSYDPDTRQAFGMVDGFECEYGYFDMAELVDHRGLFGLPLERDLYWSPRPLAECVR
jgi:hypothetical protein